MTGITGKRHSAVRISSIVLTVLFLLQPFDTWADEYKLYYLGGQSNMAGVGAHPTDDPIPPPYDVPQTDVKIWNASTGNWSDLQLGFGNVSTQFGPEITFGDNIKDLYPDDEIYLVKHAISSTDLHVEWKPDGTGHMYNTLTARTNAAIANLTAAGKSFAEVSAMYVYVPQIAHAEPVGAVLDEVVGNSASRTNVGAELMGPDYLVEIMMVVGAR